MNKFVVACYCEETNENTIELYTDCMCEDDAIFTWLSDWFAQQYGIIDDEARNGICAGVDTEGMTLEQTKAIEKRLFAMGADDVVNELDENGLHLAILGIM